MKHFHLLSAALLLLSAYNGGLHGFRIDEGSPQVQADNDLFLVGDSNTQSNTGVSAPHSGNFFYVMFKPGGIEGEYYLDFTVGSQNEQIKAWLTTSEHDTGIITSDCTTCNTANKFNLKSSSSLKEVGIPEHEDMVLYQQRQLQENRLSGKVVNDIVTFKHDNFDFALDGRILAITGSQHTFNSNYQGYIGLAPPYSLQDKPTSILTQSQNMGLIDHLTFSLYTNLDKQIDSSIKFGSYDQSAIKSGSAITYMKTKSRDSWDLRGYAMVVYHQQVATGPTPKVALIEPQLPYLYIPNEDWMSFIDAVLSSFESDGVRCSSHYCYFEKRCDTIDKSTLEQKHIRIIVFDEEGTDTNANTFHIWIGGDKLFIPGSEVGLDDGRCILGAFKQTQGRQDAWYLGNIVLADYYLIFDMTPMTEQQKDFIQIGFAPINPAGFAFEKYPDRPLPQPRPDENQDQNSGSGADAEIQDPSETKGGAGGAIAAVIIVLLLVGAGVGGFFYWRKKKQERQ